MEGAASRCSLVAGQLSCSIVETRVRRFLHEYASSMATASKVAHGLRTVLLMLAQRRSLSLVDAMIVEEAGARLAVIRHLAVSVNARIVSVGVSLCESASVRRIAAALVANLPPVMGLAGRKD